MSRRSYKIGRERALSPIRYCDGKVMYDKRGATTAANKRFDDDRIKLRIYPCYDHWHLTKKL